MARPQPSNRTAFSIEVINGTIDQTADSNSESVQSGTTPHEAPRGWHDLQDSLAAGTGLSILLVNGRQPPAMAISNNNSICAILQSRFPYSELCRPFCGEAHKRSIEANAPIYYECHAGLHCVAVPVQISPTRRDAIIGGRAFMKSADYRGVAERMRVGDLQELLSPEVFKNVIFAAKKDLEDLASRIVRAEKSFVEESQAEIKSDQSEKGAQVPDPPPPAEDTQGEVDEANRESGDRNKHSHPPAVDDPYLANLGLAADSFAIHNNIPAIALIVVSKGRSVLAFSTGKFLNRLSKFEVRNIERRVVERLLTADPVSLTEENGEFIVEVELDATVDSNGKGTYLFPLLYGGELRGTLFIGETVLTPEKLKATKAFAHSLGASLETIGMRNELKVRTEFADAAYAFSKSVNLAEPSETYRAILRQSAEMLGAERGSLLMLDEASNELTVKAAVGLRDTVASGARIKFGEGISGSVLRDGRALVVRNADLYGCGIAHSDRNYKSKSFISFPISIGKKKVGVLNITDRKDRTPFNEYHLNLLETIGPQMALALDRADWQEKAAQFQLMSITDPLTGLLNRRYLEERLAEEINRSRRNSTPMSFIMLDIDDFKRYNDFNGHQAGDVALELTAQCLKSVLRSEDVAARYGGEEFSILLPQTNIDEAHFIAQRLKQKIGDTNFPHGRSQPKGAVTVSIGISSCTRTLDTPSLVIGAADRALYVAKGLGKNRIHFDEESYKEFLGTNATGSPK